jgi:hypothetical protein
MAADKLGQTRESLIPRPTAVTHSANVLCKQARDGQRSAGASGGRSGRSRLHSICAEYVPKHGIEMMSAQVRRVRCTVCKTAHLIS